MQSEVGGRVLVGRDEGGLGLYSVFCHQAKFEGLSSVCNLTTVIIM